MTIPLPQVPQKDRQPAITEGEGGADARLSLIAIVGTDDQDEGRMVFGFSCLAQKLCGWSRGCEENQSVG